MSPAARCADCDETSGPTRIGGNGGPKVIRHLPGCPQGEKTPAERHHPSSPNFIPRSMT